MNFFKSLLKRCPFCERAVFGWSDQQSMRLFGLTLAELQQAVIWAKIHGWKE